MSGLLGKIYRAKWLLIGVVMVLLLFWILRPFLDVFVYGIFVYYVTRPIKNRLGRYIKNETLLVMACLTLLVLPLIIIVVYTLLTGMSQLLAVVNNQGLMSAVPMGTLMNVTVSFTSAHDNLSAGGQLAEVDFDNLTSEQLYQLLAGYSGSLPEIEHIIMSAGSTIVDMLLRIFLMFLVAYYLLKDDDKLKNWFCRTFPRVIKEHNDVFIRYCKAVDSDLQKIFFGNLLSIVFFAVVAAVVFQLLSTFAPVPSLQIPSPILLGILCGVSAFLPVVGMWLVVAPLFAYLIICSLMAGTLFPNLAYFLVIVLAILLFVQTLPELLIRPYVGRGQLHIGLLMFAYTLGPIVFGVSGLFLGAILLVLITHYFRIVVPEMARGGHDNHDLHL
ncbi:AI-2E family transporter [Methanocella sp. MCL-LM]|uniref:AI-2E family transporter n=1 Tax=Methanocella sp. MCL-LM TaxID=3412035 RepID=UPI003C7163B4